MSSKGIQSQLSVRRRLLGAPPFIALGILLTVLVFSFGDQVELIPLFAPLVASPLFPFFHEIHDLLAVAIGLYAAYRYPYKYPACLGIASILVFLAAHIPYAIIQFHKEAPELLRIFVIALITLFGVWLIDRLHKNEEELRATEAHARTILDSMLEGCQIIGFDWHYLYVNDSAAKQGKHNKEELLGHTMMEMYPGIEGTEMFADLRSCMDTRLSHRMENLFTFPSGSQRWFELSMEPVPEGIFMLSLDITERKQAEREINLLSTIIRRIIDESQSFEEAIELVLSEVCESTDWDFGEAWLPSRDGKVLECSPTWCSTSNRLEEFRQISKELTFLPNQGLPGRIWASQQSEWISDVSLQPERFFIRAPAALRAGLKAGVGVPVIANGQVVAVLVFFMFKLRKEDVPLIRLVSRVVAQLGLVFQRKQAEEDVKRAAKEWQTTFDSVSEWVSVHDKDFKIIRVNKAFAEALKMKPEEIIGRHCYEVIHGENEASQYCAHKVVIETGKPTHREFFNPHLGIYMEVDAAPIFDESGEITATVHIGRDITERKKIQEQLIAQDRLVSIGQLVSGVAHEINNPLTGIIGFSELLLQRELPDDVKADLQIVSDEAKRTALIVKNLLTFARKQPEGKTLVDINEQLKRVLALRSHEQSVNNIQVNTRFGLDLPQIMGNASQLQQVFFNIVINAEQAMLTAHNKGTLTITTEQLGDIVRVSIADDGPGISPENMNRLFTPFFTTKGVDKGTGLGLSICYGIITEHRGKIYAESEPGKGATFIVELPVKEEANSQEVMR